MRSTQILWNSVCIAVLLAWNTNVCGISSYEVDDIAVHDSEKMGEPLAENTKAVEEGIMTDNSIENEESHLQYQSFNYSLAIYKGVTAVLGQFPWQAALTTFQTRNRRGYCGGSLVRTNLVLTAAHCLLDYDYLPKAKKVIVLLGTLTRKHAITKFKSTDYGAHSQFQRTPRRINDIGYVRLPSRVKVSTFIKPIQMPSGSLLKETFAGEIGVASGYGLANDNMDDMDRPLSYVNLRILDLNECERDWHSKVDKTHVCTRGEGGSAICKGESGGPLVVYIRDQPILIGVTSFTKPNCESLKAQVFTRVNSYIDWINHIEDKSVLCGGCKTVHKTDFLAIEYKTNNNVIMTV